MVGMESWATSCEAGDEKFWWGRLDCAWAAAVGVRACRGKLISVEGCCKLGTAVVAAVCRRVAPRKKPVESGAQ